MCQVFGLTHRPHHIHSCRPFIYFHSVTFVIKFTYLKFGSSVSDIRLIGEQNVNSCFLATSLMTRHSAGPMSIVTPNQPPFFWFWFSWLWPILHAQKQIETPSALNDNEVYAFFCLLSNGSAFLHLLPRLC